MHLLPTARHENIVVQNLDKELLIYDLKTNRAFALNDTLTIIYRACDGQTSFDELKKKYKFTDDLVYLGLDGLQQNNLIEGVDITYFGNSTRREIIRRVGLATMIALPVIASIVAPTSLMAQSGIAVLGPCQPGSVCASGLTCQTCTQGTCVTPVMLCCASVGGNFFGPGAFQGCLGQGICDTVASVDCCSGLGTFAVDNNACPVPGTGRCTCR